MVEKSLNFEPVDPSHCSSFEDPDYYLSSVETTSVSAPPTNVSEHVPLSDSGKQRENPSKRELKVANFQKAIANAQLRFINDPRIRRKLKKNSTSSLKDLEMYVNSHNSQLKTAAKALKTTASYSFASLQAYMQTPGMPEFNYLFCEMAKTMLDSVCRAARLYCCGKKQGNHTKTCRNVWKVTPLDQWHDYNVVKTWVKSVD